MYEKELIFAKRIAREAGDLMRKNFVAIGESEKIWKDDGSPVTVTDKAINSLLISEVAKEFPEMSVLAEEESSTDNHREYVWVCDPIDGTIPFSHGWTTSVFTLALCKDGVPVLGVTYDPFLDRMYEAVTGAGAKLNGVACKVGNGNRYIGFCTWPGAQYDFAKALPDLQTAGYGFFNFGSIAYMYMLIASGQLAGALFAGDMPWDSAACVCIVKEAGGKATDLFGHDQLYNSPTKGVILSNALIHEELVSILKPHLQSKI